MLVVDGPSSSALSLAFSPDGVFLLCGHADGSVRLLNGAGDQVNILKGAPPAARHAVTFGADGSQLFFASGPWLGCWKGRLSELELAAQDGPTAQILGLIPLSVSLLAIGIGDPLHPRSGRFMLYDVVRGMMKRPFFPEKDGVRAVAAHPPTQTVAWATGGRSFSIWTITKPDRQQVPVKSPARAICFDPTGEHLVLAVNWEVVIYSLSLKRATRWLKAHKGVVSCLAISPDGRQLASGSWDGTVRLWDFATGMETVCYHWPTKRVHALAYSPDGLRLAAAGETGAIVIWDVD